MPCKKSSELELIDLDITFRAQPIYSKALDEKADILEKKHQELMDYLSSLKSDNNTKPNTEREVQMYSQCEKIEKEKALDYSIDDYINNIHLYLDTLKYRKKIFGFLDTQFKKFDKDEGYQINRDTDNLSISNMLGMSLNCYFDNDNEDKVRIESCHDVILRFIIKKDSEEEKMIKDAYHEYQSNLFKMLDINSMYGCEAKYSHYLIVMDEDCEYVSDDYKRLIFKFNKSNFEFTKDEFYQLITLEKKWLMFEDVHVDIMEKIKRLRDFMSFINKSIIEE